MLSSSLSLITAALLVSGDPAATSGERQKSHEDFARCVVSEHRGEVHKFLRSDTDQRNEERSRRYFLKRAKSCPAAAREREMPFAALRMEVSKTVLAKDEQLLSQLERFDPVVPEPNLGVGRPTESPRKLLVRYAECLAKADPIDALRFVETESGTEEENAATSNMDGFVDCMPHMMMMNVSMERLKEQVAVKLYQLASESNA